MPRNYQPEQREGNESGGNDGRVSVEGTEERSRRRMEEGGGERERVTDTSSSRVVLSVECAAHMVKLRPRRPAPLSFCAEIRSLAWSSFYIFYIKLICIFRDFTHEEQEVIVEFIW